MPIPKGAQVRQIVPVIAGVVIEYAGEQIEVSNGSR